jgi:adenine-specific DNA-methyltransferase
VLADAAVKARWLALGNRAPTEKNPQRTLLEKHLSDYTTKNTADYFIHKDLGGFLRRELDFYIKNEVMHLDDVQNAGAFADIEKNLRMIQCLRSIALELITFLAQLEDFQKKLWLKEEVRRLQPLLHHAGSGRMLQSQTIYCLESRSLDSTRSWR